MQAIIPETNTSLTSAANPARQTASVAPPKHQRSLRQDASVPSPYESGPMNFLRQQGHSPSNPFTSDVKAIGCGSVMIALNANGAR